MKAVNRKPSRMSGSMYKVGKGMSGGKTIIKDVGSEWYYVVDSDKKNITSYSDIGLTKRIRSDPYYPVSGFKVVNGKVTDEKISI